MRYLERHYEGRLDRSLLVGACYRVIECTACGVLYQSQVPGPDLLAHLYGEATTIDPAELAARRGLAVRVGYAEQIERALRHLGRPPEQVRVLDMGAGHGDWLRMAAAFGCRTAATELDPGRAERLAEQGHEVLDEEQLGERRFDLVNLEQVVEHLIDPAALMGGVVRSVEPGGLVHIGVPNGTGIAAALESPDWDAPAGSSGSLMAIAPLEHVNCFDPAALTRFGELVGLRRFHFPWRTFTHPAVRVRSAVGALRQRVRPVAGTSQWFTPA